MVASGAYVNARGLDDDTPLHDAASNGHTRLCRLLVERGADIYAKNKKGKTPLDVAAPGIAQYLLDPTLSIPGMFLLSLRISIHFILRIDINLRGANFMISLLMQELQINLLVFIYISPGKNVYVCF